MRSLPSILLNPNRYDFSIDETEISILRDVKSNLIKKYYNLALKYLWSAALNNLKRRIELFGTYEFIENLNEQEKHSYFSLQNTQSEKLNLLNPIIKLKNSFELSIINEKTFDVFNFTQSFLKNKSTEPISSEDVIAIAILFEINLFKLRLDYRAPKLDNSNSSDNETYIKQQDSNVNYHSNGFIPRRRKEDWVNVSSSKDYQRQEPHQFPKRRKEDWANENQSPKRRKSDWINEDSTPKRRKEDWINSFTPPRRRKEDF